MASSREQSSSKTKKPDAIALLKADHREVEQMFKEFEKTDSLSKKQELAKQICTAPQDSIPPHRGRNLLSRVPRGDGGKGPSPRSEVEHDGAKKLIAEIEAAGPEHDYFEACVTVLSEMIKHHVKEEKQRDGCSPRRSSPIWT